MLDPALSHTQFEFQMSEGHPGATGLNVCEVHRRIWRVEQRAVGQKFPQNWATIFFEKWFSVGQKFLVGPTFWEMVAERK